MSGRWAVVGFSTAVTIVVARDMHGVGPMFEGLLIALAGFFVGLLIEPYIGRVTCILTGHAVQWGPCPRCGRRAKG